MPHDFVLAPPRSILFVPGNRGELAVKAAAGDADAVCIDLEDGVATAARPAARRQLEENAARIRSAGKPVLVRINAEPSAYAEDIEALTPAVDAVVLAKAGGAEQLEWVAGLLAHHSAGHIPQLAMVEDLAGLDAFAAMGAADADRLCGITLGAEDFAAELQCTADSRALEHVFYRLLECARRFGVPLFGYPGSIAEFTDLERYRALVETGRDMGAAGAFCIHPRQVGVLNDAFRPTRDEVQWAREVIAALEDAERRGQGAVAVRGRMVDRPVALRARRIVARADTFST